MWGGDLVADDLDDGRPPQMSRWRGDIMRLAIFSRSRSACEYGCCTGIDSQAVNAGVGTIFPQPIGLSLIHI